MVYRGPDDSGIYESPSAWMGFRRLSILDLSVLGHQPMRFARGTLVFNGEIYNFGELRKRLVWPPSSTSDTAVLGEWLQQEGLQGLQHLRGMYAFVWQGDDGEVIAARDPFGIKPLYYIDRPDGALGLSSVATALAKASSDSPDLDRETVADICLTGSTRQPATIWKNVKALPAGSYLHRPRGEKHYKIASFANIEWAPENDWIRDADEAATEVRNGVLESVHAHLVSDVPVGILLSGGLDSSVIGAALRHLDLGPRQAFSLGYRSPGDVPDETSTAEASARFFGMSFFKDIVGPDDILSALPMFVSRMDQPSGDGLNTFLVSRLAARHVKVALSGLGADEMLAGYRHYAFIRLALKFSNTPAAFLAPMLKLATGLLGNRWALRREARALNYACGLNGRNVVDLQHFSRCLMKPELVLQLTGCSPRPVLTENKIGAWLHQLLELETNQYMRNVLLRDADAFSMAHSLELRVPLVDTKLFSIFRRIDPALLFSGHQGKQPLRKAFAPWLPPAITAERSKKTFTLPMMEWIRMEPLKSFVLQVLSPQNVSACGLVDPPDVARLCKSFYDYRGRSLNAYHLSQPLWVLLVLHLWYKHHAAVSTE